MKPKKSTQKKRPSAKKGKKPPMERDKHGHFVRVKRKYRKHKKSNPPGISPDIEASLKRLAEGIDKMKESQKKALLAISAAALALGAAATALAESADETTDTKPAAEKPKPAEKPKAAEKPKPAEKPAEAPAKEPEAPASEDLFKQAIEAAKEYASVYGREGVVKVMAKFLPAGAKTMQDIPADKLPAFIQELKG